MPTMPPPKPPIAPGAPGYTGDPNGEPGFGASKEAALTIAGIALYLASRGRLDSSKTNFVIKTAAGTLASTGALTLSRQAGHGDEQNKIRRNTAVRDAIAKAMTMPSPSQQFVTIVGKRTGKKFTVPLEEMQRLIDEGIIKVTNKKTGQRVVKIEMKKPWMADP